MLRAATLAALLMGLGLTVAQQPAPAPAVTMDDIKKAWQDRQDKVKTLKMSWSSKVTVRKGAATFGQDVEKRGGSPQPPTDRIALGSTDLLLTSSFYNLASTVQTWSIPDQSFKDSRITRVFDGTSHTMYLQSVPGQSFASASLTSKGYKASDVDTIEYYPVWWFVRGCATEISKDVLDSCELTGRSVVRNGRKLVELEQRSNTTLTRRNLWLDPNRNYVVDRYTVVTEDKTGIDLVIDYKPNSEHQLQYDLTAWRYTIMTKAGARPGESVECQVTNFLPSHPVLPSDLRVVMEPGTSVRDHRDDSQYRYIIKSNGEPGVKHARSGRIITQAELVAEAERSPTSWLTLCAVVAGVVSVGWLIYRVRRTRRAKAN